MRVYFAKCILTINPAWSINRKQEQKLKIPFKFKDDSF